MVQLTPTASHKMKNACNEKLGNAVVGIRKPKMKWVHLVKNLKAALIA